MRSRRPEPPLLCLKQTELDFLLNDGMIRSAPLLPHGRCERHAAMSSTMDGLSPIPVVIDGSHSKSWPSMTSCSGIVETVVLGAGRERRSPLARNASTIPSTFAFDCGLNIFASPIDWLRARRDGICVIDWTRAFERLRDAPRIA